MSFGISDTGFNRKTLDIILAEVGADYRATIGEVNDADDSFFSQVIRPPMTQLAEGWEALEAVYQAGSPNGAEGVVLDNNMGYNFIRRILARSTVVQAAITGDVGTVVPINNRASIGETGDMFQAVAAATIDPSASLRVVISISAAVITTGYTVTLNGTAFTITSATAVAASIAAQLVASIVASALYTVVDHLDGTFTVTTLDLETPFTAAVGTRLVFDSVSSPQQYAAVETGAIPCPTGKLDTIKNPQTGYTAITNLTDGTLGRDAESSKEARTRRLQSARGAGKSTGAAILAKLVAGDVEGIDQAYVYENYTDITDAFGRPAHSVEAVVLGGSDVDVATIIHNNRAAGIQTYGNINAGAGVVIVDDQGFNQTVKFSRPVSKYAWINVLYEFYNEEIFPSDGEALMAVGLLALGNTHTIGKNFLQQRFIGPVVAIPGIGRATVEIAITTTPLGSPSFATTDIVIGDSEVLVFDSARITVAEAP